MKNYKEIELPGNVGWTTEYETPSFTYKHVALIIILIAAWVALS